MTDPSGSTGDFPELPPHLGADFFNGLSAAQFETPAQTLLRDGFAETIAENVEALAGFDPASEEYELWYIGLESTFPEADDAEPLLAEQYRNKMLADLGLNFMPLEQDDPDLIFQYTYNDNSTRQMRYITRADGARVVSEMLIGEKGEVHYLCLLTDRRAEENAWDYRARADNYNVTKELAERLGVEDVYELEDQTNNLTLEEKTAMLEELRKAQKQSDDSGLGEQLLQDDKALEKARKRYAETVMPALGILEGWRARQRGERTSQYVAALEHNAVVLEMGRDQLEQHNALEQAKRHAELNRQLDLRRRARILGTTVIAAAATVASTALVGAAGHFHEIVHNTPEGMGAGVVIGLGLSVPLIKKLREKLRYVIPFNIWTTSSEETPLEIQLTAETERADKNSDLLNTY